MPPPQPRSTLFPYTTLFRSVLQRRDERDHRDEHLERAAAERDGRHRPDVPGLVEPSLEARHEDVETAQDEPRGRDDRERLLAGDEEALDRHREREEAEARGEDREPGREAERPGRVLREPPVEGGTGRQQAAREPEGQPPEALRREPRRGDQEREADPRPEPDLEEAQL